MLRHAKMSFLFKNTHENIKTSNYGGQSNSNAGSRRQTPLKRIFSSIYSSRNKPQPLPCTGQVMSGQARTGQVRSGQDRSGQVRSGQVRSGKVVSIYYLLYIYIYIQLYLIIILYIYCFLFL